MNSSLHERRCTAWPFADSEGQDIAAQDKPLDILVVGGGIVGAGIARDAAMRGLRVGLVEQRDFASGTSSRSSRLLHGGLRYLAQGRVGLVREASHEKCILSRIAPHLAGPMPFVFPTRKGTEWNYWKLRLGVKLYDWLCGGKNLGQSSGMNVEQLVQHVEQIDPTGLTGAVRYYDGQTMDSRLVIDSLRSAAKQGARLANYVAMRHAERAGEQWTCHLRDELSDKSRELQTRSVVNATGPWADRFEQSGTRLRLTKGVHVVVDRERLRVPEAVVMAEGSRILFAIPWGERVILGTTDTDYDGPLDEPACESEDIRYILDVVNQTFTGVDLTNDDLISDWAGIRPLIWDGKGGPSNISRSHKITMTQPGWFDVAGGKLTTYRLMAEETIDKIIHHLGISARACQTAEQPLLDPAECDGISGITPPPISRELVEHYVRNEWAVHIDDIMIRRTSWKHYHRDQKQIESQVSEWMEADG